MKFDWVGRLVLDGSSILYSKAALAEVLVRLFSRCVVCACFRVLVGSKRSWEH